jgi:chemotaxis protein MotA
MSIFPVGLFVAASAFIAAIWHLNQSALNYTDFVAFIIVAGGTVAVGLVLIPWTLRKDLIFGLKDIFRNENRNYKSVIADCVRVLRETPVAYEWPTDFLHQQLLKDGIEMIQLNIEKEKILTILEERSVQYVKRRKKIANAIRGLAKYPPAFGLMGTVLGLVNVMRGVSNGIDGKQTALEMAIALVATMYGLLTSNLLLNPAGELIMKKIAEDESFGEIAIATIDLLVDKTSLLESQELLNSFVPVEDRVNVLEGAEAG